MSATATSTLTDQGKDTTQQAGRDWLPEDLRSSPSLEKFKSPGDVAKSYLELEKMASGGIKIPKEDADPKDWEPVYTKLGRPATPDSYQIARPSDLPQDMEYDEEMEKSLRTTAHKLGLSNRQMQGLVQALTDFNVGRHKEAEQQITSTRSASIDALKKEFGNDYEKKIGAARNAVKTLGGQELADAMDESGWGDDPRMVKAFARVGEYISEDTLVPGRDDKSGDDETTIRGKIEAMFDPKHPYMNERSDPKLRQTAQQEMLALQAKLVELRESVSA